MAPASRGLQFPGRGRRLWATLGRGRLIPFFGRPRAAISFGAKVEPPGTEHPNGGVAIAQTGENEFIIVGQHARVRIGAAGANGGKQSMYGRVEEGYFDAARKWIMQRNWNGDETDSGPNLTGNPVVLKVRMGTRH